MKNYVIFKIIGVIPRSSVPADHNCIKNSNIRFNLIFFHLFMHLKCFERVLERVLESQIYNIFKNQFIVVYYCENYLNKK